MKNCMKNMFKVLVVLLVLTGCQDQTKEAMVHDGEALVEQGNPLGAVVLFSNALDKDPNYVEARYQLGLAYLKSGKLDKAEKELQKVQLQRPGNGDVLLDLTQLYLASGKIDMAESEVGQFVVKHPKNSRSQEYQGRISAIRGDMATAEQLFKEAMELDHKNIDARLALAKVYIKQSKIADAQAVLTSAIKDFPKTKASYFMLAAVEAHLGHKSAALQLYKQVSAIDGKDIGAQYMAGMLALDMGNSAEAQQIADKLVKQFPGHPATSRLVGMLNYVQGKFDDAVVNLRKSLQKMSDFAGHYFLGMTQYRLGHYELALNQFQKSLDIKPDNLRARVMVGMTLFKQKRLDDCIRQITQVLDKDDKIAMAHNVIGSAYLAEGKFDQGMKHLDRAVELNPNLADVHMKKGLFDLSRGDQDRAAIELEKAVAVAPESLNPRIMLVSLKLRQQNYQGAIETLKAGLNGSDKDALLYNYLAAAYFSQKQVDSAVRALKKAQQIKPDYLTPYFNLAKYYLAAQQPDKAVEQYQSVLKIAPDNVKAMVALGGIQEMRGDATGAKASYESARDTKAPEGFLALAGYLLRSKQPEAAAKVIEDAYLIYPGNLNILKIRGKLLLGQKKYDEAARMFQNMEKVRVGSGVALLVNTWLASGNKSNAVAVAQQLIDDHKSSPGGYLLLASLYHRLGEPLKAEKTLKTGITKVKNSQPLYLQLATLYMNTNRADQALTLLSDLNKTNPEFVPAIFALGAFYDQQGDKGKAVELYRETLAKNSEYTAALNNLAYLYADNYGSPQEALSLAVKAFRNQPSNPGILDTLGLALLKNKRYAEAVNVLRKAAGLLPKLASVHLHFGQALIGAGNKSEAQRELQTVLELGSTSEASQASSLLAQIKQ